MVCRGIVGVSTTPSRPCCKPRGRGAEVSGRFVFSEHRFDESRCHGQRNRVEAGRRRLEPRASGSRCLNPGPGEISGTRPREESRRTLPKLRRNLSGLLDHGGHAEPGYRSCRESDGPETRNGSSDGYRMRGASVVPSGTAPTGGTRPLPG